MNCERCNGLGIFGADRRCECEAGQVRALCEAIERYLPPIPLIAGEERSIEWWVARIAAAGAMTGRR